MSIPTNSRDCVQLARLAGEPMIPRSCRTCGISMCPYYPNAKVHLDAIEQSRAEQAAFWESQFPDPPDVTSCNPPREGAD